MPRQSGYFDHVKSRNELSIFKQNAKQQHQQHQQQQQLPFNRTTAPADSTTEPSLNRKRKTDLKKKLKGRRKKKKRASSSSSSSSEDSEDEDGLDPSLYDLNTPLFSIEKYIKNPEETVKEMFRSVEKSKLRNMLPENIKKIEIDELKLLCVQQLEGMSKKRIRSILTATPMEGSSGSESSEDSEDEEEDDEEEEKEELQPDSTSIGVDNNGGYEEISEEEEEEGGEGATGGGGDPAKKGKKGDIFELEMRARAIRSMLEKKKKKGEKADAKTASGKDEEEEEEEDLDILKLFDEDDSLLDGELEEEEAQRDAAAEDAVDPEERKMSVRKLAELKMKAKQEETVGVDSEGGAVEAVDGEGGGEGSAAGGGGAKQKPEKNLAMKQAEILKKAAKLRKKKKKENVDGADEGTFKVNKAKLGQRSFRKRHPSTRRDADDDDEKRPYSHTYAAYVAAFGDPNMIDYSDSYGAAHNSEKRQPRELTVEEEVRALMDELIYRVDPYGAEQIYSFYDTSQREDSYGRRETETDNYESSMLSHRQHHNLLAFDNGSNVDSAEETNRPSSNNSGQLYTDFASDNVEARDMYGGGGDDNATRDNSDDEDSSDDEDRFLDGEELTKDQQLLRARKAQLRLIKRSTPNPQLQQGIEKVKKVRKIRKEKAITLEGLGGASTSQSSHPLARRALPPPHHLQHGRHPLPHPKRGFAPNAPSHLAKSPSKISPSKKKKAEEDMEEGELSSEEEGEVDGDDDDDDDDEGRNGGGVGSEVAGRAAPFTPREAYYARRSMRKSPPPEESSGSSSNESSGESPRRSRSRSPAARDERGGGGARDERGYAAEDSRRRSKSSAEGRRSPYQGGGGGGGYR